MTSTKLIFLLYFSNLPRLQQIIKDSSFSSDFNNLTEQTYVKNWEDFNATVFNQGSEEVSLKFVFSV